MAIICEIELANGMRRSLETTDKPGWFLFRRVGKTNRSRALFAKAEFAEFERLCNDGLAKLVSLDEALAHSLGWL